MEFPQFLSWAQSLIQTFGYLGILLVSLIGSATVFFPLPSATLVFIFGAVLNPWLVALFASLGAALGELTGYGIGYGGGKIAEKRYENLLDKGRKWFARGRGFPLIVIFAAIPLPDDVTGILAGAFNYDIKKFLLASFLGKLIMNLVLALGGFYGIKWILNIFQLNF